MGKFLKTGFYILILASLLLSASSAFSQENNKKITKQSALEAFSNGEYESALTQFTQLSEQFSKDPVYMYYIGATLVNMETDPLRAIELLNKAISGSAVIKTVPDDARFYLGRALQMSGDFDGAINSFDLFTEQVGRKSAKSLGVPDYIDECSEGIGKIETTTVPAIPVVKTVPAVTPVIAGALVPENIIEVSPQLIEPLSQSESTKMDEALRLQYKADSISMVADQLRQEMSGLPWDKRVVQQKEINRLDSLSGVYQILAGNKYSGEEVILPKTTIPVVTTPVPAIPVSIIDTIGKVNPVSSRNVTVPVKPVVNEASTVSTTPVISRFDTKGIYKSIEINEKLPPGLIYLIQLAVFRNPLAIEYFKGLGPVTGIKAAESDKTYYYVGMFRRSEDAVKALVDVKKSGFNDAFVVSLLDNQPVSAERAKLLEKEWGQISLLPEIKESVIKEQVVTKDTLSSSLLFRVEVMRNQLPLKPETVENIKKLSGDRGYDILTIEKNTHVFLIGKFLNFASATEYSDLLIRNGYKEAKVVAYIGKVEIPVETAMKLFEK